MQLFEGLFLLLFAVAILRLFLPLHPALTGSRIAYAGLALMLLGAVVEGWRWQMLPAQLGFVLISVPGLRRRRWLASASAVVLAGLWTVSAFLAHQLPILSLPSPQGPFSVGTFDYWITDASRSERFSPDRNRELYVEVWYPADRQSLGDFPVQTLYHELYEGDLTVWKLLTGYFRHIPTHSHINAPINPPENEKYPVLLFNHGLDGFTSQNQLLMEHLASHGYVIFSIAHPYESMRVNLAEAGTVRAGTAEPHDIAYAPDEMRTDLLSRMQALHEDWTELTGVRSLLFALADEYAAAPDQATSDAVVASALGMESLAPYRHLLTEESVRDYLSYLYFVQGRAVEYWVEDIQFIADTLLAAGTSVEGFADALDDASLGVFGMSMGGAAAGEFCKVDRRCLAGANIDGTQGGRHWDSKIDAPFLMMYHEAHRGGNDFAYLPPTHDFWNLTVSGTEHFDFVDIAHTLPLLKTLGLAGPIDSLRTIAIMNRVHLDFFDRYLKREQVPMNWTEDYPEINIERHDPEIRNPRQAASQRIHAV